MKDYSKGRYILMLATMVACLFELAFSIVLMFIEGQSRTLFIVLLAITSAIIIILGGVVMAGDKKHYKELQQKIAEENKPIKSQEQIKETQKEE